MARRSTSCRLATAVTWLLLVYTLPSTPSRLRAGVWRDLKKVGAVYLRDGVAVLPARDKTRVGLGMIAAKVEELGGEVVLVEGARLPPEREEAVAARANAAR